MTKTSNLNPNSLHSNFNQDHHFFIDNLYRKEYRKKDTDTDTDTQNGGLNTQNLTKIA